MANQPLDLYRLFKLVVERGGLVNVRPFHYCPLAINYHLCAQLRSLVEYSFKHMLFLSTSLCVSMYVVVGWV